ncbi:hypothetical protein ACFWG0_37165 [Streptomyces yangpuensis]|uniref:hypothetical protein n=1 Tax=Streptomyces yangpuensis TaxID=1648182 RepID=UPI0036502F91
MHTRSTDAATWEAALIRLLEEVFTLARSGPRLHEDWAEDVRAVMERSVADPRGWAGRESDAFDVGWESGYAFHPFRALIAEDLHAGLRRSRPEPPSSCSPRSRRSGSSRTTRSG